MNLISHRGLWRSADEKNSRTAFERTVAEGFGTETDVRDAGGRLVVSHDPPEGSEMDWSDVVAMFDGRGLPLAVNVKADGLSTLLEASFRARDVAWFAFDMSVPEMVRFRRAGLPFYTRHSDVEPDPVLYDDACGVWLDSFDSIWFDDSDIRGHLMSGKAVCIVSPELHGRDPAPVWRMLSSYGRHDGLTLCTDVPGEAREFFRR